MNLPLISVITLTRNRSKLISRAVKSVLNQTYKNIEYIIVDGASEDETQKILEKYRKEDNRIIYIRQNVNIKPIISIDYAFSISKGEYITFLDDDDEYLPEKIEKQYKLLNSLPEDYGFVYCWMDYYDDKTGNLIREHHETLRGDVRNEIILNGGALGGTPTLFFRQEAFKKLGGWSKKIKLPSDYEMRVRAAHLFKTDYVPKVLVKVHINHGYSRQMTDMQKMNYNNIQNKIEFKEYFLTEFKETYKKHPKMKNYLYLQIIKLSLMINDCEKAEKYFAQSFKMNPFNIKIYRYLLSGIYNYLKYKKQLKQK